MGRKTNIIITAATIILLFIILIIVRKNNISIEEIEKDKLLTTLSKSDNSVVYFGKSNSKVIEKLKYYNNEYDVDTYTINVTPNIFKELFEDSEIELTTNSFVLFENDIPLSIVGSEDTDQKIFYKYLYKVIPEDEIEYKVLSKADDYVKKVNSNKFTVAVFGKESCSYCRLYLNTINEEAKNKKVNIYYFDADNYDPEEYIDIITKVNFVIPKKCSTKEKDTTMMEGFDKPLTVISKNGEMVDCLLGYVSEKVLNDKLVEVGVINE